MLQALLNNPKLSVRQEDGVDKFLFKPIYDVRDRKGLLNLLKKHDLLGLGGVLLDDVEESVPNFQKVLRVS